MTATNQQPRCVVQDYWDDDLNCRVTGVTVHQQGFVNVKIEDGWVTLVLSEPVGSCDEFRMGAHAVELFYYPDGSLAKALIPRATSLY